MIKGTFLKLRGIGLSGWFLYDPSCLAALTSTPHDLDRQAAAPAVAQSGASADRDVDRGPKGLINMRILQGRISKWRALPTPPNVPLLRGLWSLLDGICGVLKGSWGGARTPQKPSNRDY